MKKYQAVVISHFEHRHRQHAVVVEQADHLVIVVRAVVVLLRVKHRMLKVQQHLAGN
jgi:hypothetical protein